jgi:Ca-activated chloride channel homolog
VTFSPSSPPFDALAGFWARRRIDDLMSQDWLGLQQGAMKPALKEQITQLGLDYRLMTQFTSFVAVEDRIVTKDGKPQRIEVPVEMPEGVSHQGVFGEQREYDTMYASSNSVVGGMGRGVSGGIMGGVISKSMPVPSAAPKLAAPGPPPPPPAQPGDAKKERGDGKEAPSPVPPSRERQVMESKFQPAVLAVLDCVRKNGSPGTTCGHVQSGKIAIEVWLKDDSPAVRSQLKALGFELKKHDSAKKTITGNLAVEKLEGLAKLAQVQFVSLPRGR